MSFNPKDDCLIRILDDDESVRLALSMMLEAEGWQTHVYATANDFLTQDQPGVPGCLLLDVRMPKINGLQLQELMIERGIALPVIFITGHADIDVAIESLKRGAADFLLKPIDEDKLFASIDTAIRRDMQKRAGVTPEETLRTGVESLSDRQREILEAFLCGATDAVVARRFALSERTVQGHRAAIYRKLGAKNAKGLELLAPELRKLLGID